MNKTYRFHGSGDLPNGREPVLLRKRTRSQRAPLHLISADPYTITDELGTRPIETYRNLTEARPITLTRREADLIALANPGIVPPEVLEDLHPWLPEQRYLNDSASSFDALRTIVRRYDRHLVSPTSYCDEKWSTICNALRRRSLLDARFYTAWHLPIQDVHILEERRQDRSVIAIDFNGMYPACMQQPFPKPADLRLISLDRKLDETETLGIGLYRCILEGPSTDFITRYNPLRSFHCGRHLRTGLDEAIEVDLNEFEVEFFRKHFRAIHLVESIVSDKTVRHPLAKEVQRSFANRRSYHKQGNKALADREKFLATLMASCASRPSRPRRRFSTRSLAMDAMKGTYGIDVPLDEPETATEIWLQGRRGIRLLEEADAVIVQGPDLRDGSACHLLGQRIVARGRMILLAMMERIHACAPDVQICYTNIDSIHFSLPTEHLDKVLAWLRSECSEEMGSFKIEALTRHGLWLEPGRYWLYSDGIEKFRNRGIGDRRQPFKDHAIHVASRQLDKLHVPIKATLRMETTMSPLRSLRRNPQNGLIHQHLMETGSSTPFTEILSGLETNARSAIPIRMAAFRNLEQELCPGFAVAKGTENTPLKYAKSAT